MALPLRQSRALAALAEHLYDYLPGSGNPSWKGHISFKTVAMKVGVGRLWQAGSKEPMIRALLEGTFELERSKFEPLILEIVRAGIAYRQKRGNPLKPEDVDHLNGLILDLGFKFPDLWDPDLHASLRMDSTELAENRVEKAIAEERLRATTLSRRAAQLEELKDRFFDLHAESDRQAAGRDLEDLLNRLFALFGLAPREPFRLKGEQIDGSFDLDHETYLVEAKWEKDALPEAPLLVFRGKIEGKSAYTRGVFISLSGITGEAKDAITRGKQPSFFLVDGHDLTMVLTGNADLQRFLRQRRRLLAEEGLVVVPFHEIGVGSRRS